MLLQNKKVAIVGGGPGGLILARLLQQRGVAVRVYERDRDREARLTGSPLDMHEGSGPAALREADLLDAFKAAYRPGADKMVIVNEQAEVFFRDGDAGPGDDFGSARFRPEIDRGPLRNLLLDSLQPETVEWDRHFIAMSAQDSGWLLQFKASPPAYADLVIAADGANSKIRPYITGVKAVYSGITMLEGNVRDAERAAPHIYALADGGKILAFGKERNLLLGQKGNGDLGFYASFKADESWARESGLDFADSGQVLAWFKIAYPEWNPVWYELFRNAAPPFIPRPIYCMPLDQTWTALPNATMLGDAAHVMPPFAGEGANMAMLDALTLSRSLTSEGHTTLQEAIASYEMAMRRRASAVAAESLRNGERMHAEGALQAMLDMFAGH